MPKFLMNPGPTNTTDAVREVQDQWSDVCHRTPGFADELARVKTLLLNRFLPDASRREWEVAVIGGSGTFGMEAMISSLLDTFQQLGIECVNEEPGNTIIGFQHSTRDCAELQAFLDERDIIIYVELPGVERSFRVAAMSCLFDESTDQIEEAFRDSCLC